MKLRFKDERGTSMLEFALILPLLVMLVMGIIEFSFVFYDRAMITNASREGARAGIVYNYPSPVSDPAIAAVVDNYLRNHPPISLGDRTAAYATYVTRTGSSPGGELRVRVDFVYTFLVLPHYATNLTGGINLQAETAMRME